VLQRHAIEKLHRDEVLTCALVNFEDHADVGMVQRGRSLRFALEASESLCVLGNVIWQKLQSYKAVKLYVFSFVDDAHPAAELLDDTVVRDRLVDHCARILRG
jgi:hypothetical protein